MESKSKKVVKWFSAKVVISACVLIASVFIFALIADEAVLEHENRLDDIIFSFCDSVTKAGLIQVMTVFTFFGSAKFLFPAYTALVAYFFIRKKNIYAIETAIIGLGSQCLLYALKQIFHRHRPDTSLVKNLTTYSFPSGHTFSSFIFYSLLIYLVQHSRLKTSYKWLISILLFLFALTISISRVVLKVHYPTDVFASLFLAVAWIILLIWLLNDVNKKWIKDA